MAIRRRGHWLGFTALALGFPALAHAQQVTPSQITPQTLRPAPTANADQILIPETNALTPPPGADRLTVTLASVQVEGGFPELADQTSAIVAPL